MTGSAEFSTWTGAGRRGILAGLCAIYSSSLLVLILAALIGAWLGYKGERICRLAIERALALSRSR